MNKKLLAVAGVLWLLVVLLPGCSEGQDDWNSSAKISGYVYTDATHTTGVSGVQVVLESDPNAEDPYRGADRWVVSSGNGYFEKSVFLGRDPEDPDHYDYVADMSIGYFYNGHSFRWTGGVTVSPGSHFTLPPVDLSMFE
jgi:hypothetical protein